MMDIGFCSDVQKCLVSVQHQAEWHFLYLLGFLTLSQVTTYNLLIIKPKSEFFCYMLIDFVAFQFPVGTSLSVLRFREKIEKMEGPGNLSPDH